MVQVAIRITTILSEQHIKSSVEGLMGSIMFLSVHDRPDVVILDPSSIASDREFKIILISLTSSLTVVRVDILKWGRFGRTKYCGMRGKQSMSIKQT